MPYFVPMMQAVTLALSLIPVSPSSPFDVAAAERGLAVARTMGMRVLGATQIRDESLIYLNGSDDERLAELQNALSNDEADLVWLTRGGYGLTRIMTSLTLPAAKMPIVVGYSDATALHFHLWQHRRAKGIHGPMLAKLDQEDSDSLSALSLILQGRASQITWPRLQKLYWPNASDKIEGTLFAANLTVLTHLIGTASMASLEGAILVLEDIGERPYRIDRMLTQLEQSGSLRGVRAIVLGRFTDCEEPGPKPLTAETVVLERCKRFGIPLLAGLPIGHVSPNWALPFGVKAQLKASDDVELTILEEIF